ncbi:MAG: sigma-70 family RNA polymerase sigma factor [Acidobacteriota bacterium]
MKEALAIDPVFAAQDERIAQTLEREQQRLRQFIRRRVPDPGDAEDILQEVFFEFVAAYRMMKPIEQAGAWLFRVARNRIIDRFRKKQPESLGLEDLLPSADAGPDAAYARRVLEKAMEEALDELPADQRTVFLAHEFEGRSFRELSEETGVSVNTLLSRKHYAVLHLRKRLQTFYDELEKG